MPMEMKDRLSGNLAVVRENVESFEVKAFHHCPGNPLCRFHNAAQRRRRELEKGVTVVRRDDQGMTQMNGSDVQDGYRVAVLIQ